MTRPRFEFDDDRDRETGAGAAAAPPARFDFDPAAPRRRHESGPPVSTLAVGTTVILGSLVMLFVGFIGAYVVLRFSAPQWPPPNAPTMPKGLWGSTALLAACSATLHFALLAARRGDTAKLKKLLAETTILGLAFLGLQAWLWTGLFAQGLTLQSDLYGAMFYTLTGLHAAHVFGGIAILLTVFAKASRGRYSARSYGGVGACAAYWHFLGAIWIVLFLVLVVFP